MTRSPTGYAVFPLLALFAIALAGCGGGGSGLAALKTGAPIVAPSDGSAQPQESAEPQETAQPEEPQGSAQAQEQPQGAPPPPRQSSGPRELPTVDFNDYFATGETGDQIVVFPPKPKEKEPEFAQQKNSENTVRQSARLSHYCRPDRAYSVQGKVVFENSDPKEWGVWVRKDPYGANRATLFGAEFDTASTSAVISGTPTGSRPAGNMSYEGRVVGRHTSGQAFLGTVELEFAGATNEMSLTFSGFQFGEFGRDHEIVRNNIAVAAGGSFSRSSGSEVLSGNFYGDNHAGVGGSLKSPGENIGLAVFGGVEKQ